MRSWLVRLAVAVVLSMSAEASVGADPVRILGMGTLLPADTPVYHWCSDDPLMALTIIPTRLGAISYEPEDAKRLIRLYFPRKLDRSTVDLLLFSAGDVVHFTSSQIAAMTSSVKQGVAAMADCGGTSAILQYIESWVASGIDEIFPNDVSAVLSARYGFFTGTYPGYFLRGIPYTLRIREDVPNNPFSPFLAVGIERVHGFAPRNVIPKPGSAILADMIGEQGFLKDGPPFSVAWMYEDGRTLVVSEWLGHPFWGDYASDIHQSENRYGHEMFLNLVLYLVGRPISQDIVEMHRANRDREEMRFLRDNVLSAIDFAANFGANVRMAENELADVDGLMKEADALYLEGEFGRSSETVSSCIDRLRGLFEKSLSLKDRALASLYMSEWLAITGTLVICGLVLYEMMVRRRIYKVVQTTRT